MAEREAIPGESEPADADAAEAKRWISVYEELIRFEGGLLSVTRERMEELSEVARREAQASNIAALEDDCNRYKSRLEIWRRRLTELETR
jgi:hypothetical protein